MVALASPNRTANFSVSFRRTDGAPTPNSARECSYVNIFRDLHHDSNLHDPQKVSDHSDPFQPVKEACFHPRKKQKLPGAVRRDRCGFMPISVCLLKSKPACLCFPGTFSGNLRLIMCALRIFTGASPAQSASFEQKKNSMEQDGERARESSRRKSLGEFPDIPESQRRK